jgi:hypothetical protein
MENMDGEQTNTQSTAILKELSDIKATLAVNTTETVNIKGSLTEMKVDIKEIRSNSVPRTEHTESLQAVRREFANGDERIKSDFNEGIQSVRKDIALLQRIVYGAVGLILVAFFGGLIALVIN